ncbi:NAD-dependent epimerase/dehydratase family protein [Lactovum odontotermitis]
MKIVIFGGSGFVGEGLVQRFGLDKANEIFVISRQRQNKYKSLENVQWIKSDLMKDTLWQSVTRQADWVIDCIGILLEKKGQTYQNSSVAPAKQIIHFLASLPAETRPKFLFVSTKKMPWFFNGYLQAKFQVEAEMRRDLPDSSIAVFPSLIYDKSRKWKLLQADVLKFLKMFRLMSDYQPQTREFVADEVIKITLGKSSILSQRNY